MLPVPPVRNTVFFVIMSLSEPVLRVLRLAILPKFEVDLIVARLSFHGSQNLSCGHLVTCLDIHRTELAVECEIVLSMLYQHALVVSRHYKDLLYDTVEDSLNLRSLLHGNIDSVVGRKFKVLEYRMVLLAELSDYRSADRPWKF